jgi:magnesium transporter
MDVGVITDTGFETARADELPHLLTCSDGFVWVDIPHCDADAARVLSESSGFIRWRAELRRTQPGPEDARLHRGVFVVLHAPERGERGHVHYLELDQFIGHNYLVTVHGPTNAAVSPAAVNGRPTRSAPASQTAGCARGPHSSCPT